MSPISRSTPQRQPVLAHQLDPLACGPGQLGGLVVGRCELGTQDVPEQPHRAIKVTDVMLDQVQAGRRAGSGSSAGGADGGGEPACWATWMTMPWASRGCRKAFFQPGSARLTPMGRRQRLLPAQPAERQTYSPGGPDSPAQPGAGDSVSGLG
jgi:hypothetical protein